MSDPKGSDKQESNAAVDSAPAVEAGPQAEAVESGEAHSGSPAAQPKSEADPDTRAKRPRKAGRRLKRAKRRATKWQKLDADGRERPAFLEGFPDDPELNELCRAFELGNYAFVRERAPKLAESSKDGAVKEAALELAERIRPDPLLKYTLIASVLLLLYLIIFAYTGHGH